MKIKTFLKEHKRLSIIVSAIVLALALAITIFLCVYDFTKIEWDPECKDIDVTLTEPTTLSLSVIAKNRDHTEITDIDFVVSGGTVEADEEEVLWTLPKKEGTYTIKAIAPKGKTIEKEISVIILKDEDQKTLGGILNAKNADDDSDKDQIIDSEEAKLKTNPYSYDTDGDGIGDYEEINTTKTDPLKYDSDDDGLSDGDELYYSLNPLTKISKNDGIVDGDRVNQFTVNKDNIKLDIQGKGNITKTNVDIVSNEVISSLPGVVGKLYNLNTLGKLDSANLKIEYNKEELASKDIIEDNLTILYFNEKTKKLEKIDSVVNKTNHVISAKLTHFSLYTFGDSTKVNNEVTTDIMMVIDNSVSMYNETQMQDAGYKNSTGAIGNDTAFKRLTLSNKMIDTFTGNYRFGVAEFSGNYVTLTKLTNDRNKVAKSINGMRSNWESDPNGTNIVSALQKGINEFSEQNNNHYMILLTDGKNTKGSLASNKDSIVSSANAKKIHICVIGLGTDIDTSILSGIASATGCKYYSASNAHALDEIYAIMGSKINYNYVDTDDDGKTDGMVIADTGFLVNRDGFSFDNYASNKSSNGHCFGMAMFAKNYYTGELPVKLDDKDNSKFVLSQFGKVDFAADGYDFRDTFFADENRTFTKANLYDFKFTSDVLDYYMNGSPSDIRDRVLDDIWMYKDDYLNKYVEFGFSIENAKNPYKKKYTSFSKYQRAVLNDNSSDLKHSANKTESNLINAIWRLFILQLDAKNYYFDSEPDISWNKLYDDLSRGIPSVITINSKHSINAIRLISDTNNANKYKLEVYDNNYSGETRYIDVTRASTKGISFNAVNWSNDYTYTFKYDSDNDGVQENTSVRIDDVKVN